MKQKKNIAGTVREIAEPLAESFGYILWDVEYVREGADMVLRITIDTDAEGGITIEDCEKVTEPVNKLLDEVDPIKESYMLEIGSAGLERELVKEDHFEVCEGDKIRIRFIRAVDGEKEICAFLKEADKTDITVELEDGTEAKYPFADIAFVKLWFDFD